MNTNEATSLLSRLSNHWSEVLLWPGHVITTNTIKVTHKGEAYDIAVIANGRLTLNFVYYNREADSYSYRHPIKTLIIDESVVPEYMLYLNRGGYALSHEQHVKAILQIASNGKNEKATTFDVSAAYKRYSAASKNGILRLPAEKFASIMVDARDVYEKGSSYRASVHRFLSNRYAKKHIKLDIQHTTSIVRGEFDFLVHRLNLPTKRKKEDYVKYLDNADIGSLQGLTLELIDKEVFDDGFLRILDEYFIKEKLQRIVSLGKSIVKLKSGDLSTDAAVKVLESVFKDAKDKREVKQLETLWQRFFEQYLLYLIFSYREIYPKIALDLEGNEKFPDFIGINHYLGVDVIEIKTHLAPALTRDNSHDTFCFSPELSKAIIQTTNYMDAIQLDKFKDDKARDSLTQASLSENLHRPRGIIIISSNERLVSGQKNYDGKKITRDFTKLRNSLHNIEILTFDEVLSIAEYYTKNIIKSVNTDSDSKAKTRKK